MTGPDDALTSPPEFWTHETLPGATMGSLLDSIGKMATVAEAMNKPELFVWTGSLDSLRKGLGSPGPPPGGIRIAPFAGLECRQIRDDLTLVGTPGIVDRISLYSWDDQWTMGISLAVAKVMFDGEKDQLYRVEIPPEPMGRVERPSSALSIWADEVDTDG